MPTVDFSNPTLNPVFKRPELLQHPQIPAPLAQVAPRAIKGVVWWDIQRRAAYQKNNYFCWACNVSAPLHGHEVYKVEYDKRRMHFQEVTALCETCHNFIHIGRYGALLSRHKILQKEFKRVVQYGFYQLQDAGLLPDGGLKLVLLHMISSLTIRRVGWIGPILNAMNNVSLPQALMDSEWSEWRLVFEGREYGPKFNSREEFTKEYR